MRISGVIGGILTVVFIFIPTVLGGGAGFIDVVALIVNVPVMLGLGFMTYGKQYWQLFTAIGTLFRTSPASDPSALCKIVRSSIIYAYAAGVIGVFIGTIQILRNCDDPSMLPLAWSVNILCLYYSVLIAECILRPAQKRIENMT